MIVIIISPFLAGEIRMNPGVREGGGERGGERDLFDQSQLNLECDS